MIICDSVGGMESEKWIWTLLEPDKNLVTVCVQDFLSVICWKKQWMYNTGGKSVKGEEELKWREFNNCNLKPIICNYGANTIWFSMIFKIFVCKYGPCLVRFHFNTMEFWNSVTWLREWQSQFNSRFQTICFPLLIVLLLSLLISIP